MPVLRSQEVLNKTLDLPPLDPPTPARSDASPIALSPSPGTSLVLGSDSSATGTPPLRRSPRLASTSNPAPVDATNSKRKGRARASSSSVEEKGGDMEGTGRRSEARVLEGDGVDGSYMNLRSGSRITKRRIEVTADVSAEEGDGIVFEEKVQKDGKEEDGLMKMGEVLVSIGNTKSPEILQNEVNSSRQSKPGGLKRGKVIQREEDGSKSVELDCECTFLKPEEAGNREQNPEDVGMEERHINLRSGTKIAGKGIKIDDSVHKDGALVFEGRNCQKGKGKGKLLLDDEHFEIRASKETIFGDGEGVGLTGNGKFSAEEKGKGKMVVQEDLSRRNRTIAEFDLNSAAPEEIDNISWNADGSVEQVSPGKPKGQIESRREADRSRAIELAPKFAFFRTEEDHDSDEEEIEELEHASGEEDWPGPFSTAMKLIEERQEKLRARELNASLKINTSSEVKIQWTPSKSLESKRAVKLAPSLNDLCMKILLDNAEEIESLEGVPDALKHRLILMFCHYRKMNSGLLAHLLSGSPTEIRLSDCSWATDSEFEGIFGRCDTGRLKVVQLDLCGRCLPDYTLRATLARSSNSLPLLTSLSLKGAYSLSDDGLDAIVSSAPLLSSLNLSECSLITSTGICNVANKLELVLKELYIDDCQNVNVMLILPALKKIKHLEILSVAGLQSVRDKFVHELIPLSGYSMRELHFAGCLRLTTSSIKIIGENCPQLSVIDLRNLKRLNDNALGHLANGCGSIQKLKLCRNAFSDEAVAAFIEASGSSLTELALNNVEQVCHNTAAAISRRCSLHLHNLDLSFCRKMTDEALGLIADSCLSLRILKLFGCTQVTDVFLNGHSNSSVKIIGLQGKILDQLDIPDFL
ncbi:uncharacterized protein [Typha angustifolia]|uniref:uncharacterized protein isoform X3 n=1 Tax=Typha angustifolia TaxID=59011 RepID=UPI003C305AEB